MTDTLLRQVALVSEAESVTPSDLSRVSAALQKQATRDLVQFWDVKATVDAFPRLEDVPIGYWPIIIMDDIQEPGAAGIHKDDTNGQPFALVTASDRLDVRSLTTSHEMIEMLVDPSGDRLVTGDSPKDDQGRVQFLVEACDPSEDAQFAYTVNGILVSDFYSVRFFDPVAAPGVRYSFTGAIQQPRQVLSGGYLSWVDPASNNWWQETWFDGDQPGFRNLGRLTAGAESFRSQIDRLTAKYTNQAHAGGVTAARAAGVPAEAVDEPATARAANLRRQIASLTGKPSGRPGRPATLVGVQGGDRGRPKGLRLRGNGLRPAPSVWEPESAH
ncbi:MAG: hypothetical protein JOY66_21090 [Acetobacteraceae bacterium]|nr:hypothetical protein [Acetobacteraceae bacterium]